MAQLTKSTVFGKRQQAHLGRKWYLLDVQGKVLGRVASRIAYVLRGKHKPDYSPTADLGDHVVVLNASKIKLTGKKLEQKESFYFTGYHGGHKRMQYKKLMVQKPEQALFLAVKGMLPKNSMGRSMIKKMKVYRGDKHPHLAQAPLEFPGALGPQV
jgi:large subunit ribosomal protein L13